MRPGVLSLTDWLINRWNLDHLIASIHQGGRERLARLDWGSRLEQSPNNRVKTFWSNNSFIRRALYIYREVADGRPHVRAQSFFLGGVGGWTVGALSVCLGWRKWAVCRWNQPLQLKLQRLRGPKSLANVSLCEELDMGCLYTRETSLDQWQVLRGARMSGWCLHCWFVQLMHFILHSSVNQLLLGGGGSLKATIHSFHEQQ